ncbi:hypothetical protein [Hymenobacter arizonensis]|uniref:Uncharacterized protein n=1 Tax=Hymenobacter arizonensis TaxID=1227077 RepID=A0A1I5YYD4_HYMAR|nr:hypothetical protein [Hymenobacter arizonensis]SFQ49222.1 hypothetical protein SAMN04515668_2539 [Hymenobacter arizonensis]
MYSTYPSGQAAVGADAAHVAALRAQLTALTFGNPLLSAAEQLRANHAIHECEDADRLARWLVNTRRELARRAEAREVCFSEPSPVCYATGAQKQLLLRLLQQPHIGRAERTRVLLGLNRLTRAGATVLRRQLSAPPGLAGVVDRRVAAGFSPGLSLTYADLVRG